MLFFHDFPQKIQKSLIITTKTCTRIHIFKCIYLDGENDSNDAVKTKNAQFFMIFPNILFLHMIVIDWPGRLKSVSAHNGKKSSVDGQVVYGARIIWIDPEVSGSSPSVGDLFLQLY